LIKEARTLKQGKNHKMTIINYEVALSIFTLNSSTSVFEVAHGAIQTKGFDLANVWIRKGVAVGAASLSYLKSY
jgi:hypothetical protein